MLRSTVLTATLFLMTIFAQAQVVNYGGYATTAPSVVSANGSPSVPAISTPVAHVGAQAAPQAQPGQEAQAPQAPEVSPNQPEVVQIQNPAPVTVQVAPINSNTSAQPMNLGAASVDVNPFLTSAQDTNRKSLGDVAREMKQKQQTTSAKTYTNADIDKLNQSTGVSGGTTTANASNDNWPSNNGVITPTPGTSQGSIAAPAQSQSTTGNAPFTPRTPNAAPAGTESNGNLPNNPEPQENGPQAKTSAQRPYEMAQNNPANAGVPQQGEQSANESSANDSSAANHTSAKSGTLPKTATRLPLLGILGFFSISMGLFVRYQRTKTAK